MSGPSRLRPSENREPLTADDLRADILVDEEPPFVGRQDLNPWHPAFAYQLFGEGSEAPGGVGDDEELDGPPIPLRRAQRWMKLAPAPRLDVRLLPLVGVRDAELMQKTAGSGRIFTITPADLRRSAETFARYRLTSTDVIRHTDGARAGCCLPISGNRDGDPSRRCI